jgi:hypothetical protein
MEPSAARRSSRQNWIICVRHTRSYDGASVGHIRRSICLGGSILRSAKMVACVAESCLPTTAAQERQGKAVAVQREAPLTRPAATVSAIVDQTPE